MLDRATLRACAMLAATSLIAIGAATPAAAQETAQPVDEEGTIVVTATLRETSLLDVPFSINAQTEEDIRRANANTIEDLSRNVAGLTVQNLGPGQSQVSVRGVSAGQVVRDQPGVKEQVGVYLDDSVISLSLFTPDLDLFDLNRVETLRGPQGTLFGAGSVGGTLRYITNQPVLGAFEGVVEANLNTVAEDDWGGHLKGAINVPLGDTAAIRAVGYYTQYGGFVDALREDGTIDQNVNDGHRVGGRISLRWEPSDGIVITPRVLYQEIRADGFNRQEVYNLYANPFTTTRPPVVFDEREQFLLLDESFADDTLLADLNASIDFGAVTLTSVTTYINRDIVVSRDASALSGSVSVDLGFPTAAVLLPSNLVDTTDLETWSQEVRLGSSRSGPFQWLVGAFYSKVDRFYRQRLPTPGYDAFTDATLGAGTSAAVANGFPADSPYNSDLPYDIRQFAVFGEASLDITERFTVTAGGRYYDFKEERSFISGGLFANGDNRTDETSSNGFSPRVIAQYEVDNNIFLNAQASKGFRLGGVNDPLNLPLCTPEDEAIFGGFQDYDDETLWNYEVGLRGQRRGIRFSAAGFYTDISNLQVTLDAGSCSSRIVFNVPKAHTAGVEFEVGFTPLDGLDVSLAGSVLDAKFDSTVVDGTGTVIGGIRDGNRLPSVPNFQIAASVNYSFPVNDRAEGFFGFTFQHVGTRYTQPSDQENNPRAFVSGLPFGGATGNEATVVNLQLPSYQLVNLTAGIDWDNGLGVSVYVNNLLDENTLLSFDRERGGRARLGFNIGQPRTIGITVRKTFGS
ncbi:TonB-dependent receptor [Sphingosinicella sp. LHD-64]|uniref:TonB-dependent receptor n=1 Tax=Sphingosinicella sp. LHD-64 TaxID=3072139 RepID=UPI00280FAD89|nr:TonB-dependent receptor [Sphingosinicella sp. LHD-64]MDQ8755771.1 TonB-dependent receptor [Sphingosinicella sp. LHD-64]